MSAFALPASRVSTVRGGGAVPVALTEPRDGEPPPQAARAMARPMQAGTRRASGRYQGRPRGVATPVGLPPSRRLEPAGRVGAFTGGGPHPGRQRHLAGPS